GSVRPDDRVGLSFLDLEIDVGKSTQTTEVLLYVCRVEDDVWFSLDHVTDILFSGLWIGYRAFGVLLLSVEARRQSPEALHEATWQEADNDHEQKTKCQVPAFTDKL